MKLFSFLDDWLLDSRIDVVRRFCPARLKRVIEHPKGSRYAYWNSARKCFEAFILQGKQRRLLESADGRKWRKAPLRVLETFGPVPKGCVLKKEVVLSTMGFDMLSTVLVDAHDPDRARRFKCLCFPYTRTIDNCGGIEGGPGVVICSPDGIRWTMHTEHEWYTVPKGSDTTNNLFYNPKRKVWQAICRIFNNDRRIAMTESADLVHWTEPRVIVHPDVADPQLMQFYGMPAICYEEEYFIGAMQTYRVPSEEKSTEHSQGPHNSWSKWTGTVDGQLVYSYDGQCWCRSDRTALIPRGEPGEFGSSCVYPFSIHSMADGIRVFAIGTKIHHGANGEERLMEYNLRKDGFAYLEPVGGWGYIATRCIGLKSGAVRLNYQAPDGQVFCQVTDVERKPIKGYTYADSIPLAGDDCMGVVRWKKHGNLDALLGKRIRLEFKFTNARIYALRAECGVWYGNTEGPIENI